jgi:hypothetical protein
MKQCAARVVLGIRRTVHGTFARDGLGIRCQRVKTLASEWGDVHFLAKS